MMSSLKPEKAFSPGAASEGVITPASQGGAPARQGGDPVRRGSGELVSLAAAKRRGKALADLGRVGSADARQVFDRSLPPLGVNNGADQSQPDNNSKTRFPPQQLTQLENLLQHLWGKSPSDLGFRGGWRWREPQSEEGEAAEWPRVGIGGRTREERWSSSIHGDSRGFVKVVKENSGGMAYQGGAWRGRLQTRPPGFRGEGWRPPAPFHQGRQDPEEGGHKKQDGEGSKGGQSSTMAARGVTQQYRPVQKSPDPVIPKQMEQAEHGEQADSKDLTQMGKIPRDGMFPNTQRLFCSRCKGQGHLVKDCSAAVYCINCAKPTHRTEDCTFDKQPRPVAKLVGYGAPGLGCILI